jgi:integrase
MPTISIRRRKTGLGESRYDVRYRLGGRAYPIEHAGTFKTEREAKARRDLVAGEIANGRNPAELLAGLSSAVTHFVSLEAWGERFVTSRIDVAESTRKMYRSHLRMISETFGDRDPHSITAADVAEWVVEQAETLKPGTVAQRLDCFKLLLDYTGTEPNPAHDPRVKLPKRVTEEANPPSDDHFLAIIETLLPRWRLFFITIEQGGIRIGEAVALRWGMSTSRVAGYVSPGPQPRQTPRAGCSFRRGSWRRSRTPARLRIECRTVSSSRGSTIRRHGSPFHERAVSRRSRTTRRMIYGTAGSRCGISRVCPHGSSQSVLGTLSRR